jgi:hypothetical protein
MNTVHRADAAEVAPNFECVVCARRDPLTVSRLSFGNCANASTSRRSRKLACSRWLHGLLAAHLEGCACEETS